MKTVRLGLLWCFSLLTACGGQGGEVEEVELPEPVTLARITIEGEHRVEFVETIPGSVTISETGAEDFSQLLLPGLKQRNLPSIYRALGVAVEQHVMQRLEEAQLRVDRLNEETEREAEAGWGPIPEGPSQSDGATDSELGTVQEPLDVVTGNPGNTDGGTFMVERCWNDAGSWDDVHCRTYGTGMYDTGWAQDIDFVSSTSMHASSSGTTYHYLRKYICTRSFLGVCVQKDWRTVDTQAINTLQIGYYTDTFKWTRFRFDGARRHLVVKFDY